MKILLVMLISISTFRTFGQDVQTVNLRWKIGENEKLRYSTAINDLDTTDIQFDFDGLFKALSDSTKNGLKESKDIFKKLDQAAKDQNYTTTLSNKGNGVIDIVMTTSPKERKKDADKDTTISKEDGINKLMQSMNQGVVLRGSVYKTGGIHSFWLKSNQKNVIAVFFELPTRAVKIGDKWPLDIDLIANDQSFECDSSYKINEVVLTDIKKVNGEMIAVLRYNIVEYVKGRFQIPSFLGGEDGPKEAMMKFTHEAIAEFSIDKGRWVTYDGIMSLQSTGIMTADKKTRFKLIDAGK